MAIWYQNNSRSAIVDDFSEEVIGFFSDILDYVNDYRIKSRLADILWLREKPKNSKHVEIAIANYQEFSLEYDDILNDSREAWERAIRLALAANKPLEAIHNKLMVVFENAKIEDGYHLTWIW